MGSMTTRLRVDDVFARDGARPSVASPGTELLDGVLVRRGLPTAAVVQAVVALASDLDRLAHGLEVAVREAIACPPFDVLRPEVALRRPVAPHLRRPAPGPSTVLLAILVSDDERETTWRARRCAAVGLLEVWTVVPGAGHAVRLAAPRGGVYTSRELLLPGELVAPAAASWLQVTAVPLMGAPAAVDAAPGR